MATCWRTSVWLLVIIPALMLLTSGWPLKSQLRSIVGGLDCALHSSITSLPILIESAFMLAPSCKFSLAGTEGCKRR